MARLVGRRVLVAAAAAAVLAQGQDRLLAENCFVLQTEPGQPFPDFAIAEFRRLFLANLNVNDTGAVIASPGACPALDKLDGHLTYKYHWTRDSALSMAVLYKLAHSEVGTIGGGATVTKQSLALAFEKWRAWEESLAGKGSGPAEPKWNIQTGEPYGNHWCRPQTDGPGLRARTFATYALGELLYGQPSDVAVIKKLWARVAYDLDWLSQEGGANINANACDLWEETSDWGFLWNEVSQRVGLLQGVRLATFMGDPDRAEAYFRAVYKNLARPMAHHMDDGSAMIAYCRRSGGYWDPCKKTGKDWDGALVLSFIHSGWLDLPFFLNTTLDPAALPTAVAVAKTVEHLNRIFCGAHKINRLDTEDGIPGVLYGRYELDGYAGGNPWVLISAALATLFYQCAQVLASRILGSDELLAWRAALNAPGLQGISREFLAAGDGVLARIKYHIDDADDGWHLYEQIDKTSGKQYNARDLTWSYAEVLNALHERTAAAKIAAGESEALYA